MSPSPFRWGSRAGMCLEGNRHRFQQTPTHTALKEAPDFVFHIRLFILQCLCLRLYLQKSPNDQKKKRKRRKTKITLGTQSSLLLGQWLLRNMSLQVTKRRTSLTIRALREKTWVRLAQSFAYSHCCGGREQDKQCRAEAPGIPCVLRSPYC